MSRHRNLHAVVIGVYQGLGEPARPATQDGGTRRAPCHAGVPRSAPCWRRQESEGECVTL